MANPFKLLYFFLIFFLSIFIFACTDNTMNFEDVPGAPRLMNAPEDTSLVEIGIDAYTGQDESLGVQLDWSPGVGVFPDSFRVFRKRLEVEEAEFELLAVVSSTEFDVFEGDTIFTYVDIDSIFTNQRNAYFVTAVGPTGSESEPSDTLDYMLIAQPENLGIVAGSDPARPEFSWSNVGVGDYVLKVLEADSDKRVWIGVVQNSFAAFTTVEFNQDGRAVRDSLSKDVRYKWRVDAVGTERNSGSESRWRDYVY